MSSGTVDPDEAATSEYNRSQEEIARHSRDTGGDAPAAASLAQREALARGDEPFFEDVETSDADTEGRQEEPEGWR